MNKEINIVEVVGCYVDLVPTVSGDRLKGLCPFHKEKTPSFMVNSEQQTFHCYGCGEDGDVNDFIMKIQDEVNHD